MIVIGIDPHKSTHTAAALNEDTARELEHVTVHARDHGHARLLAWADAKHPQRRWAIEDCRHVSGRLERALIANGESVVRVPPKLMGQSRREARTYGKSDPIDAVAVARAAIREPDLPEAIDIDQITQIRLLIDRHDELVAERTREGNRLRWHLHDLAPDFDLPPRKLAYTSHLHRVQTWIDDQPASIQLDVLAELADRIDQLNHLIKTYRAQLRTLVRDQAQALLDIPGCAILTAARIIGEVGPPARFTTDAKLAMHAGTAPLPVSSGRNDRHRLNRRGNRRLNAAIHRIAISQLRHHDDAKTYIARRVRDDGKTKREAIRTLKRHLTRQVFQAICRPALT